MYATAREFFEAARDAARDAERIGRELRMQADRADGLSSGGFEPRIRSTPEPDRMATRVAAYVDREQMLTRRMDEDYRLIDAACEVLYGKDGRGGLYALIGWPADAIYHRYLALRTWPETAALVGYSEQHVRRMVSMAFEYADSNGDMWTRLGVGLAE